MALILWWSGFLFYFCNQNFYSQPGTEAVVVAKNHLTTHRIQHIRRKERPDVAMALSGRLQPFHARKAVDAQSGLADWEKDCQSR